MDRKDRIGVVVIGRNESENLRWSLSSLISGGVSTPVIYVDSGSKDGSPEIAQSMGVVVHELDAARPFSAARARDEGVTELLQRYPDTEWIQFVDGDCALESRWIDHAIQALSAETDVGIVCGNLFERAPELSVYNWLSALQWRMPCGPVEACGGIFMIRRAAYDVAGGFNHALLTGEERDLCRRVAMAGYRVLRLDVPMAIHDSGLVRFGQWWRRGVWGGYGDAMGKMRERSFLSVEFMKAAFRRLFWPLFVPIIAIGGGVGAVWSKWCIALPVLCLCGVGVLFWRLLKYRTTRGDSFGDSALYATLMIIRKFATGWGFLLCLLRRGRGALCPDPHAATESASSIRASCGIEPASGHSG